MNKYVLLLIFCAGAVGQTIAQPAKDTTPKDTAKAAAPPKPGINDKVKSSKKHTGLFTVYQDTVTGSVQLYIKKNQLDKEFIYQSFSISGPTQLYLNQSMHRNTVVFGFRKKFDKIEIVEPNINFYYDKNNAVSKAANVDHATAIAVSEKIVAEDSTGYLIAADGFLLSEKFDPIRPVPNPGMPPGAMFSLGNLNPAKSKYELIRSYPENTDVVVELAYDNPMPMNGGGKDITDARYNTIKMQHSFIAMPENDYTPRYDDPRVGYFTTEVDDLTSTSVTPFRDVIHRWHLKKKDPSAAVSEPVTPITFWVENTTPVELRPIIIEAGLKWNEAFEKAGFKNAVVMKQMPDDADWDPADIRYNVIRWVSSSVQTYGAIGPSFTNPRTGQILGSDITVEWRSAAGSPVIQDDIFNLLGNNVFSNQAENPLLHNMRQHHATCNLAHELSMQLGLGFTAAQLLYDDAVEQEAVIKESHQQFLYYLILHEMGHTLGLNHNMKASTILTPAEVHNKELTRRVGLMGSVMDYPSINLAADKSKQGDYYTTKAGPYDIWAIQYGYTPFPQGEEAAGLEKILSRSGEPYLTFGNDADDMRGIGGGIDPRVMVNDMSGDMAVYAEERYKLVNAMIPKLQSKIVTSGRSYQKLISSYNLLNNQRNIMTNALANYIGGVYVERAFPGTEVDGKKPYTPVSVAYQKKVMGILSKYIFAPDAFKNDEVLYPYLQTQRRGFNLMGGTEDPKPQNIAAGLHNNALGRMLNPVTLQRINNTGLYGNTYGVVEVMNDLTDAVFKADINTPVNIFRKNLQNRFTDGLISIFAAPANAGYDYASKAAALATIQKIKGMLNANLNIGGVDAKAHKAALLFKINKALEIK